MRGFVTKFDRAGIFVSSWIFSDGSVRDVAVDAAGNVYVTGTTNRAGTTTDAFVAKLDSSGSTVFWLTLGGSADDFGNAIAVGPSGTVVVVGYTKSPDFPLINPLQSCVSGPAPARTDAFVAKLDPNGAFIYSTCLGGSDFDEATRVAIHGDNAYVMGRTRSNDYPTTPGVFQPVFGGGTCAPPPHRCTDLFVTQLNSAGSRLVYSSFFGGNNGEEPGGLALDGSGNAYISGSTTSRNLPTARPLQPGCRPAYSETDCGDAFIAKISATGAWLDYSTYLGGSRYDAAGDVAVAADGTLYVVGDTWSEDFPARREIAKDVNPDGDIYIARVNVRGSGLEVAIYGGARGEHAARVALDARGAVYVSGTTNSPDFPLIRAFQSTLRGDLDAFVLHLDSARPGS